MNIPTIRIVLKEIDYLEKRYKEALLGESVEGLLERVSVTVGKEEYHMTRGQQYAAFVDSFSRMRQALQGFVDDVDLFLDRSVNGNIQH